MNDVLGYCKYFLSKYFIQLNLHLEYCEAIHNFNLIGGIVMCLWRSPHLCYFIEFILVSDYICCTVYLEDIQLEFSYQFRIQYVRPHLF